MQKSAHVSEIVLVVILLVIMSMTRIYYDDGLAPMVVWKGEFGLKDTLVKIGDFAKMPRPQLETEHRDAFFQMEDMGLLPDSPAIHRHRPTAKPKT